MVGGRAKQAVLIEEEEEKGCGPTSPGFVGSDGHVTSTTRTWPSLFLRDSAESPNRVMVASQAYLSWATFSGRRKPRVPLRVAVCLCGGWSG